MTNLKPHQTDDLAAWWHAKSPRVLWNNNVPGTGKTVDGIVCWRNCLYDRVLIVCLAGVRRNWLEHADAWFPGHPVIGNIEEGDRVGRSGPAKERAKAALAAPCHVVSYELLPKLVAALKKQPGGIQGRYDYIIVDEFHTVKDRNAGSFKALYEIRMANKGADLKLLSGTPAGNEPLKMWPWLDLSEPGKWGKVGGKALFPQNFGHRFGNRVTSDYTYSGFAFEGVREDALPAFRAAIAHLVRRVTLADIGIHVPYSIHPILFDKPKTATSAALEWLDACPNRTVVVCTYNIANIQDIAAACDAANIEFVLLNDADSPKLRGEKCQAALERRLPILTTTGLISTGINYLADVHEWLLAQPSKDIDEVEQLTGRFLRISSEDKEPRTGYLLYDSATAFAAKLSLNNRLKTAHALQKASQTGAALESATGESQSDLLNMLEQLGAELAMFGGEDDSDDED